MSLSLVSDPSVGLSSKASRVLPDYSAGMPPRTLALRAGWICLLIVSLGILAFGVAASFGSDPLLRADGVALTGMGLFGTVITVVPFRRRERWAWVVLWFYPVFWLAHLIGSLPPGQDHVHQVVFILLALAGLLVPAPSFFGKAPAAQMKRVAN